MEIMWTNSAISDLKEFKSVTKKLNSSDYIKRLIQNVDLLKEQPHIGKIYVYIKGHIIRQFIHKEHRVFYYEQEGIIHIVAIVHHKQDIKEKMKFLQKHIKNPHID